MLKNNLNEFVRLFLSAYIQIAPNVGLLLKMGSTKTDASHFRVLWRESVLSAPLCLGVDFECSLVFACDGVAFGILEGELDARVLEV